ncbi:MAG TPA: DUF2934 domain-containing protein [Candidatus Sulfotelmatobacter sp.]|jgi:hypothetical protein|nr:DUF2934 domain-containing protein [Candidatus Sulfotelmatobacter sp.]
MSAAQPDSSAQTPVPDVHKAICRRAEEIYIRSGRIPGRDVENWTQAEKEVRQELAGHPTPRKAIVVKVNGVQYLGEYTLESAGDYHPGEFGPGAQVPVRFEGDKMYIRRPNGKELETTVIKKVG